MKNTPIIEGILHFEYKKLVVKTPHGDFFVQTRNLPKIFFHGDFVKAKIVKKSQSGKMAEVQIIKRIQTTQKTLLGTKKGNYILPLPSISLAGKIKTFSTYHEFSDSDLVEFIIQNEKAQILKKFEHPGQDQEIDSILFLNNISEKWNAKIKKQEKGLQENIAHWKEEFSPFRADMLVAKEDLLHPDYKINKEGTYFSHIKNKHETRINLENWFTFTIDGKDAKDLDDAISIAQYKNGDFLLGVHIADVSYFVQENSPIDLEAKNRGTSIYLPDRVIPMLPEALSNDLCSLQPNTPKNTLTCLMRINPKTGKVIHTDIFASQIISRHRGIYDELYKNFQEKSWKDTQLQTSTEKAFELFEIIKKRRKNEGKIEFETTELYFELEKDTPIPKNIIKRTRNDMHMLIEEFMVIANEEVAKWCKKRKIPFLSRVHPEPSDESVRMISKIIGKKYTKNKKELSVSILKPKDISGFLEDIDADSYYHASRLILPKMSKALYSANSSGHFGLALEEYSHFTSPIRRYPDLITHRMIHLYLNKQLSEKIKNTLQKQLRKIAEIATEREKQAEGIEREVDKIFALRYMQNTIGQQFSGKISSVIEWGVFVELENGIEVTVYFDKKHKYQVDSITGSIIDKNQKIIHKIGENITVVIKKIEEKRIIAEIIK